MARPLREWPICTIDIYGLLLVLGERMGPGMASGESKASQWSAKQREGEQVRGIFWHVGLRERGEVVRQLGEQGKPCVKKTKKGDKGRGSS